MAPVSEEMLVDVVDSGDKPTGVVVPRKDVLPRHLNFRVIHIFLFNRYSELLVQQLGYARTRHGGYWGSSVAGYVFSGERYEQAAERRLEQELGVRGTDLHLYFRTAMNDQGSTKFISLFLATYEGPVNPDPTHIDRVEYLGLNNIRSLLRSEARPFTPTFRHLFEHYDSLGDRQKEPR